MNKEEKEKAEFGAGTLKLFCDQFGNDVHSHILLEVLLEGIINAETLFVLGEQEQERDQIDNSSTRGSSESSELGFDGLNKSGNSDELASPDTEDLS